MKVKPLLFKNCVVNLLIKPTLLRINNIKYYFVWATCRLSPCLFKTYVVNM